MVIQHALVLTRALLHSHGLFDWHTELMTRWLLRAGQVDKEERMLYLSVPVLRVNDADGVRELVLHEIAHILCWTTSSHSAAWRAKALEIGCSGERHPKIVWPTVVKKPKGPRRRRPTLKFNPRDLAILGGDPSL